MNSEFCFAVIPMGTYCSCLVADMFLFCYERDFMVSLSKRIKSANEILRLFSSIYTYYPRKYKAVFKLKNAT